MRTNLRPVHVLTAVCLLVPAGGRAQTYPLSENTWSNPEFVQRFLGSYGFDTETTPTINSEEKALLEAIAPLVAAQPAQAIQQLKAGIKPDSSPALTYTLANLQFQGGALAEAEAGYREAIRRFPNFLRAYKNLGIVHVQQGRHADAVPLFLKVVQLGGQGGDVYGLLGYGYLNSGNSEAALRAYEQALFFEPGSRDWRMGRVQCLMNLGRHAEAIGVIEDLVERFPAQGDLLMLQANAYVALERPLEAAATVEILRSMGKATPAALTLLGDIYLNFSQADLALGAYAEAVGGGLSADRSLRVAKRLAVVGAWSQLDGFLGRVESSGPSAMSPADEIEVLNLKAQSDLAQGKTEAAAGRLAEVVRRDPLNGRALVLLANYHSQKDETEKAEIYYERAAKVEAVAPEAMLQHARMLVARREFKKAVPLIESAQTLRPQPHVAQYLEKVVAASRAAGG